MAREGAAEQPLRRSGRGDRVVADLDAAFGMRKHGLAEMAGEHLRTEADAQKRRILLQRDTDPVDLRLDVVVRIVGAHGAAEDDGAGVMGHRVRESIAEARTPNVKAAALCAKQAADATRGRVLLVEDNKNRAGRVGRGAVGQRTDAARLLWAEGPDHAGPMVNQSLKQASCRVHDENRVASAEATSCIATASNAKSAIFSRGAERRN